MNSDIKLTKAGALCSAGAMRGSIRVVVSTHGAFAEGICGSLKMICGEQTFVEFVNAYLDSNYDYSALFHRIVSEHDYSERPLVVVTDLLGGSVNNEFMQLRAKYPFYLVTGLNLPLLIELATYSGPLNEKVIDGIVRASRNYVTYCGEDLLSASDDFDF